MKKVINSIFFILFLLLIFSKNANAQSCENDLNVHYSYNYTNDTYIGKETSISFNLQGLETQNISSANPLILHISRNPGFSKIRCPDFKSNPINSTSYSTSATTTFMIVGDDNFIKNNCQVDIEYQNGTKLCTFDQYLSPPAARIVPTTNMFTIGTSTSSFLITGTTNYVNNVITNTEATYGDRQSPAEVCVRINNGLCALQPQLGCTRVNNDGTFALSANMQLSPGNYTLDFQPNNFCGYAPLGQANLLVTVGTQSPPPTCGAIGAMCCNINNSYTCAISGQPSSQTSNCICLSANNSATVSATQICDFASNRSECNLCFNKPGVYTPFGCIETNPQKFVERILKIAISVGGGIAFLMILYGAIIIMLSSGNPEKLNGGKDIITSAIAGLLLIVFSVVILKIIGVDIFNFPGLL